MKRITKQFSQYSSQLIFALALLWSLVILVLGAWWVYIMINFEYFLSVTDKSKISKMLTWEGGSFLVLLILLSLSLMYLFVIDQKKSKSLQAFFASLTHELKTPLASIRLQGEVIHEILEQKNDPKLDKLIGRLISDTTKLETQMDKILQLSRIERGGQLNLSSVSLIGVMNKMSKLVLTDQALMIHLKNEKLRILADEFALELILKNLFENTKNHSKSKKIDITIKENDKYVEVIYQDHGEFNGDLKKLGSLFYKHNSSKGSGIGLYLSKKLMNLMNGEMLITNHQGLNFHLTFEKSEESHA